MPKKTTATRQTNKETAGNKTSDTKKPKAKCKKVVLKEIGVPDDVLAKLAKANILTVGDATNYMQGGTTFDSVNNVSKSEADSIVRLLDDWFVQNPKDSGEGFDEYLIPEMVTENQKQILKVAKRLRVAQRERQEAQDKENVLKERILGLFKEEGVTATPDGKRTICIEGFRITVTDKNPSVSIKPPKEELDDED